MTLENLAQHSFLDNKQVFIASDISEIVKLK